MKHQPSTFIDQLVSSLDHGLRSTFTKPAADRVSPGDAIQQDPLHEQPNLKQYSASLMRVNHVGEVCAQALYQGQALTSRSPEVRKKMQYAAKEEIDHLNWCYQRIEQLDGHTSYLNPIWYLGSLALGIGAGLTGDRWSLGFLAETERQVVEHLESHLDRLPKQDTISRAVVTQMAKDEAQHADMAETSGAAELPRPIKDLMRATAKIMTTLSEKI
ncbi:2-polyprenyl-3-methyl-6-methoxy-1,4-benzoquinone monooxygenase [Arenicella xantha]|uniref:3-demethoxyubiquinol 3-hydroxylase n=1 Tax=Arenicella xantha TaxID=644221 RepID=A0A395JMF2_9GAMM|nr:2-polyprenyl-3-methyl-6-methoxy-1,4-benzoquinone monooxygenase [Arenicella xantha]RBP52637.1 ubiquinone biosynthesis monooxygenase Coq7 [Arenicella xantha]